MKKNIINLLVCKFALTLLATSIGLSTFMSSSCSSSKAKSDDQEDTVSPTIHINEIIDNECCHVDSSLFPKASSFKFDELATDLVLGVNEQSGYLIGEVTITFSVKSAQVIKITLNKDGVQTDKKYDGITFTNESNPQEFNKDIKFSKILRIKKETLKKIINDVKSANKVVDISFNFGKPEKRSDDATTITKLNVKVGLSANTSEDIKNDFKGIKFNSIDDSSQWYHIGEHTIDNINELSSIIISFNKSNTKPIGWPSDDQRFFIQRKFDNEQEYTNVKQLDFNKDNTESDETTSIVTFKLDSKFPLLDGDIIYMTNIQCEYVEPNAAYYYTCVDDSNRTIFLNDDSVETDNLDTKIDGFYIDQNKQRQKVEYSRNEFDFVVDVGENITTVGDNFLRGCEKIEHVNFKNGFNKIYSIGHNFMNDCKQLKNIKNSGMENKPIDFVLNDKIDSIDQINIGNYFLTGCSLFNQEIIFNYPVNLTTSFLSECTNFNSNITFNENATNSYIDMHWFMHECQNMTSTITINIPSNFRIKSMYATFYDCSINALSTRNKNAKCYTEGIKIAGKTDDHANTFMSMLPNITGDEDPSILLFRKLIHV